MNHNPSAQPRNNPRPILPILTVGVLLLLLALFWRVNHGAPNLVRAADRSSLSQTIETAVVADECVTNDPDLPSGNCSNGGYWGVGWFVCNEICQGGAYRALVRPDLPQLPAGAVIQEALLFGFADLNPNGGQLRVSAHRITSDWEEGNVTWGSQPSFATPGNLAAIVQNGGIYYGMDITAIVQDWYDGLPNNGVVLISEGENQTAGFYTFHSREAASGRPYLVITYETATPTPTDTSTPTPTATPTDTPTPTATSTATPLPASDHMDIGDVRVWADVFSTANGITTASGNVILGPKALGEAGKYFTVNQPVNWGSSGPLNLNGILGMVHGGRALGQGSFSVDPASGVVTWAPGNQVLYSKLGGSNLSITPTLTVNIMQGKVNGSAQLALTLPESNAINANLQFMIGFSGLVTGATTIPVQLKLAGGTLSAQVSANSEGLVAAQAQYTLAEVGTLQLNDLVIDGKGDAGLRFGAAADFKLPDLNIGSGFFRFTQARGKLSVNTATTPLSYQIGVTGKLNLDKLPENGAVQVDTLDLKIVSGALAGKLSNFRIKVAGRNFDLNGVSFGPQSVQAAATDVFSYTIFAEGTSFSLPQSWAPQGVEPPKVTLKAVTIQTQAPYITIGSGGATFNTTQPFYLGGDPNAKASVRFDQIQGEFRYVAAGNEWQVVINTRITFLFGAESASASGLLTIKQGGVSGQLLTVNFTVAGLNLAVNTLDYKDDAFTAAAAELTLPASWGGEKLIVNGLRIDKNGVQLGGAGGSFNIPDRDLSDVLRLTGMSAAVTIDAQRRYTIKITAVVTVRKVEGKSGGNSVSVGATLEIKNGRVGGSLDSFGFRLAGIEFDIAQPRFLDNRLTAQVVALTLPVGMEAAAVNDVGIKLYGLEIGGPKGFSVQGGGFKLPDFKIGEVGVRNAQAEFVRLPDGSYSIKSSADIAFAAITVGGSFHIVYDPPSSIGLREVRVLFQGSIPYPAIPIGNTGFFITGISGGFDLTSGTLQVEFGVHGAYAYEIAGIALFSADAKTVITFTPWSITMTGQGKFIGIPVSNDTTRISATSFMTDGTVENQIWRGIVTLAFGMDADNEFTVYGRAELEVGLRKGSIGCIVFVCLPPFDFTVARRGYDAGKFLRAGNKVWGARTYAELFGLQVFIFARFAPGIDVEAGTNLSVYKPVLPALRSAEETAQVAHHADIDAPAVRVTIAEAITTTNRAAPLPLQATRPDGVSVTPPVAYESADRSLRTYALDLANPASAVGRWTIRTQPGNALMVWAADPPAQITNFTVSTGGVQLASGEQQPGARLSVASGSTFQIAWSASNDEPGLAVDLFAVDARGTRYVIASQSTQTESQLSSSMDWAPDLPSGVYTLTLQADDRKTMAATVQKQPITIVDITAPAAPVQLQAQPQLDGSVLLTWNGVAAETDIAEYWVSASGGSPAVAYGRVDQFTIFGLSPGGAYQIAVEAVDASGNHGAPAIVSATIPTVIVVANHPRRAAAVEGVSEVWATFNQPITPLGLTVVDGVGKPTPGLTTPIAVETSIEETAVIGARFTPGGGVLSSGHYTATLSAQVAASGDVVALTWGFDVIEQNRQLFLPIVVR